jgi:hypothetical protein
MTARRTVHKVHRIDRPDEPGDAAATAVSRVLEAGEAVVAASRELHRRMAMVAPALNRQPRVMVGYVPLADGTVQPQFVGTAVELDACMAAWRKALAEAGGTEDELGTVDTIVTLLSIDLNADIDRIAEEQAAKRVPEAVEAFNEAVKARDAARLELSRVRPSGLAEARLMAEMIAMDVRHGVNPSGLGHMAVNLERALSEMVHGEPQKPMWDA